jgi:tetratricopeptide (TPR) repeat protein
VVQSEQAEQQVRLWLRLAQEAYVERQLPKSLHYFVRALDYAKEKGLEPEVALVCRDLGYVYTREGSVDKALECLDQGLAVPTVELSIKAGLMANKASVLVRLEAYREALALLDESSNLIRSTYTDFENAPGQLVYSYAAIVQMAEDLRKVVAFLDMGIRADRIKVEIIQLEPSWAGSNGIH